MIISRLLIKVFMLLSLIIGTWHLGHAAWIYGKAYAASFLIDDAWQATLVNKQINKPWSWADTWPVASISIPAIDMNKVVLAGDSGSSLAFAPGLSHAGSKANEKGVKLISGHRDTHFEKLRDISIEDEIFVKTPESNKKFKVIDIRVVDVASFTLDTEDNYDLILATCYPFNSISVGGTERFIVGAIEL
ncbi:class GN sortase [Pseudomonadota bacterium]